MAVIFLFFQLPPPTSCPAIFKDTVSRCKAGLVKLQRFAFGTVSLQVAWWNSRWCCDLLTPSKISSSNTPWLNSPVLLGKREMKSFYISYIPSREGSHRYPTLGKRNVIFKSALVRDFASSQDGISIWFGSWILWFFGRRWRWQDVFLNPTAILEYRRWQVLYCHPSLPWDG